MQTLIEIPANSRYKDTAVYEQGGVPEFALWNPPKEFVAPTGCTLHRVVVNEIGFLDLIAYDHYGKGYEHYGWVIQAANAILDPETEMFAGQVLLIPPFSSVLSFQARSGNATTNVAV